MANCWAGLKNVKCRAEIERFCVRRTKGAKVYTRVGNGRANCKRKALQSAMCGLRDAPANCTSNYLRVAHFVVADRPSGSRIKIKASPRLPLIIHLIAQIVGAEARRTACVVRESGLTCASSVREEP